MNNKNLGQDSFNQMLNKESNIAHYLMSTPFSSLNNLNYGYKLQPELFKKEFLVYNNLDLIEQEIIDYLDDISQNTVLITGYQGCGKTTFVNYLVDNIKQFYEEQGKVCNIEKIDFEKEGKEEKGNPFKKILVERIVENICECTSDQEDCVMEFFINNYLKNKKAFAIIENRTKIQKIFGFLINNGKMDFNTSSDKKGKLYKYFEELKVPQLLTLWSYYIICYQYIKHNTDFVHVLLLDNIDDIYKNEYTEKFIRGLKEYHELGSQFIAKLIIDDKVTDFNLYINFNFIFCLRDTSAAKFSYHFTTRAVEFFHKDISEKVDKKEVINNKIKYLEKIKQCKLREKADIIKHICNDNYTIKRIFPLYNNDYRTAVNSLCGVLIKNDNFAKEYCEMTEYENSAAHFGAHGIVLRLILDSFEKQGYFKSIGSYNVETRSSEESDGKHNLVDYSIPRVILTFLYNYQEKHKDSFLNNLPDTTINLKRLYDAFKKVISPEQIAYKLEAMYALHLKQDWNHLLNINATYDVTGSNINSIFDKYSTGDLFKEEDGSVAITCAGRVFVRRITTHYEYFACRYFEDSIPLFLNENFEKINGIYRFDKSIGNIFGTVENCIEKAYEFDKKIVNNYYYGSWEKFKKSSYIYQKKQTHAERIINHHISYIDAYRHYIIQRLKDIEKKEELCDIEKQMYEDRIEILKRIIEHIKNYMNLMKKYVDNEYFSKSAEDLLRKYTEGINKIGEDYLSEHLISFILKKGEKEDVING